MRTHPGIFGIFSRRGVEDRKAIWSFAGLAQSHLQNFGEMQRMTISLLRDLLAATETVGDDEPVGWSPTNRREKFEFADGFRNFVFVFFEAEGASHAAASGGGRSEVDAHALQHGFFGCHLHDGLVMAMPVDERPALQFGELELRSALLEEFAQQEDLLRESLRAFIFGEKIREFIAEDSGATRFENNDGRGRFDFWK